MSALQELQTAKPTCTIGDCANRVAARGMCNKHYYRFRRHGDPNKGARPAYPDTCTIEGCEKPFLAQGYCGTHYSRWSIHGDPNGGGRHYPAPGEAFSARTEQRGDCLVWTGTLDENGYGRMSVDGKLTKAHRYAWEQSEGAIPEGMTIDHTCWNRACSNVDHLRLSTQGENTRNRAERKSKSGFRGVFPKNGRFEAKVWHEGVQHYLGMHDTAEGASRVASEKRRELFGEFAGSD